MSKDPKKAIEVSYDLFKRDPKRVNLMAKAQPVHVVEDGKLRFSIFYSYAKPVEVTWFLIDLGSAKLLRTWQGDAWPDERPQPPSEATEAASRYASAGLSVVLTLGEAYFGPEERGE